MTNLTSVPNKWDYRFLQMAEFTSRWSLDPSTKCGAVIVDDRRRVISLGYNGLSQGVKDTPERLENRELKYRLIVHCERNALIFAERDLRGCTLYTWPFMSCAVCAAMVIQAGIKRVVAPHSTNPRWLDDFALSTQLFNEAGVQIDLYDLTQNHGNSLDPEFVKGAWFGFDAVLAWINTQLTQSIDKADLYRAVMQLRPEALAHEEMFRAAQQDI